MAILHQFFVHWTKLNGHSFKHCLLIMTHWTNFDAKTIAHVEVEQVAKAREFAVTAPSKSLMIANSCCWQSKQPNSDIMSTAMENTIIPFI
jgi:hypothetical protein